MTFTFKYNSESISAEVITNSFSKTEIYWNNLKQADNSARFQAVFTIELSNFLKTYINNDILVEIKDGDNFVFYGYVRKSIKFTKTQINQPVSIEVVSPSFLLNKEISKTRIFQNKSISEILATLLDDAGVEDVGTLSALTQEPTFIRISEGTYKDVITELLYEFGFCWDFSDSGVFEVYPLFNVPDVEEISNTFNGSNCLDQIDIQAKEREFDSLRLAYGKTEKLEHALIFRDDSQKDNIVEPHTYFAGVQFNYLDAQYDNKEVLYIENLSTDIATQSGNLTYTASLKELDTTKPNYNELLNNAQICFTARNNSAYTNDSFTKFDFFADAIVKSSEVSVKTYGSKSTKEMTAKYICDSEDADRFAENFTNWSRYANNTIILSSKENYPLGSFVKVTDYGIGTYYGRIIQKTTKIVTDRIDYKIETVEEFTPATATSKSSPEIGGIGYGQLDALLGQANEYTNDKVASAQMQASPIYSAVFNATVIKKGNDGAYSPSNITARGRALTGDTTETAYTGLWKIYVNNQTDACLTLNDSAIDQTVEQLMTAGGVDELTSVRVDFLASNGTTLIDSQIIPILTGAAAYTVILDNPMQTYEADETGAVTERTVQTKARVYYGLSELEYLADDGWEYGAITGAPGFHFSVDVLSGVISITAEAGSQMPENGRFEIPIFIHSQTNTENVLGYTSEARAVIQYELGYGTKYVGFLTPDENGYYYTYFNFQKLSQTAVKLAQLNTTVQDYWNELTRDLNVTEAEKNTLTRLMDSITAEYGYYSSHYNKHTKYSDYASAYTSLKSAVDTVTGYDGTYTFSGVAAKDTFNAKFENYYAKKSILDNEIMSTSTNNGGLDTVNKINALNPKPTDYFAWVGTDNTTFGNLTLRTGMTYAWNGSAWVVDTDNGHITASMPEVLQYINDSNDETIPAVTYAKQIGAMRALFDSVFTNELTVKNILKSANFDGTFDEEGEILTLGTNGFALTKAGELISNRGWFRGGLGSYYSISNDSVMKDPRPGTRLYIIYAYIESGAWSSNSDYSFEPLLMGVSMFENITPGHLYQSESLYSFYESSKLEITTKNKRDEETGIFIRVNNLRYTGEVETETSYRYCRAIRITELKLTD